MSANLEKVLEEVQRRLDASRKVNGRAFGIIVVLRDANAVLSKHVTELERTLVHRGARIQELEQTIRYKDIELMDVRQRRDRGLQDSIRAMEESRRSRAELEEEMTARAKAAERIVTSNEELTAALHLKTVESNIAKATLDRIITHARESWGKDMDNCDFCTRIGLTDLSREEFEGKTPTISSGIEL